MAIASRRPLRLTVTVLLALALHPTIGAQVRARFASRYRRSLRPLSASRRAPGAARCPHEALRGRGAARRHRHASGTQGSHSQWRTWERDVARQLPMEKDTNFSHLLDVQGNHQRCGDAAARGGAHQARRSGSEGLPRSKRSRSSRVEPSRSGSGAHAHADHHQAPGHAHLRFHLRVRQRTIERSTRLKMSMPGRWTSS